MKNKLARPFLIFLVVAVLIACFLVFRPFLIELIIATILVSVLYSPYEKLSRLMGHRRKLAAFLMCLLALVLIILPLTELLIYAAQRSISAYNDATTFINQFDSMVHNGFLSRFSSFGLDTSNAKSLIIDVLQRSSSWMVEAATLIIKGATGFLMSLILIVLAMFFFFLDGERMLKHLMVWSPLPDEYDMRIFRKFRAVSYSTMVSTFVTAAAQGLVGAIGFGISGLPVLFSGILIGVTSLLPYIGSVIIYVPVGLYLLLTGHIGQGIFLLLWGFIVISNIDNILRTYMIKGKAGVNSIFIFFSIIGGVILFGFWGVVLGPLIISLAITIMHIYEQEFGKELMIEPFETNIDIEATDKEESKLIIEQPAKSRHNKPAK